MDELNSNKVVQHNELIKGVAHMDLMPLKIFELCVSEIDTDSPPENNILFISKKRLFDFFGSTDSNRHSRFKQAVKKLQEQSVFQVVSLNNKGKEEYISIVPIPTIKWNNYSDEIEIEFNKHIMPYLINLKENFTQYLIRDIGKLSSKYSIVLYKWISMNYNLYEKYGNLNHKNPYIEIAELREFTNTANEYLRIDNFFREIIDKPLKDINDNTFFSVSYEKKRFGKQILGVQFQIEHEVKERSPYDKTLIGTSRKELSEKELLTRLPEALQDTYVQLLILENFIEYSDVLGICKIYHDTVPLYRSMDSEYALVRQLFDDTVVKRHLRHIKNHMINEEHVEFQNMPQYLFLAASQFLRKLEANAVESVRRV